jgi:sarcosine oxidase subunit beta
MEMAARSVNAMHINGVDAELLSAAEARALVPLYNSAQEARYPIFGAVLQKRAGTARHDAVAWGYARAADHLGVDIIQACEVRDFIVEGGRCRGVRTSRGDIRAERIGMAVAGHSSVLAKKAGFQLPVTSYALQACVSEPVKPALDIVVLSPATGTYVSQSDKGEMVIGGGLDRVPSYGQRGNLPTLEIVISGLLEMFPSFRQLRLMRQWAGIVDVVPDSSPILGESPLAGLFLNCGWGTGGFKAIPAGVLCSPICSRPEATTRSAAPSTWTGSRAAGSSTWMHRTCGELFRLDRDTVTHAVEESTALIAEGHP